LGELPILEQAKQKFGKIVQEKNLLQEYIKVEINPLSPRQAIGTPIRQDYPILVGKEVIVEAKFRDGFGQSFTDKPQVFEGTLQNVLELPLTEAGNRAIFIATLNAVTCHLGLADRVRHCKNEEPEQCAAKIAEELLKRFGKIKVGLIGLQPAILENLVNVFGAENVRCSDLNPNNVGAVKYGCRIDNGATDNPDIIKTSEVVLVTSSTLTNDSFDALYRAAGIAGKPIINFGITGSGVSALLGLERLCFYGH
jgi:hypothetical protein